MFIKTTKKVNVGGVIVGGGERVKIQSMTTTKTADVDSTLGQIWALEQAGCEIIRVAIADEADALALRSVVDKINIPLVADISKQVYNSMESEITTKAIGEMVMERLKKVDEVSYVRYASVYRSFKDLSSFMTELKQMMKAEKRDK